MRPISRGFTLLEVVIGLLILSLSLTVLMQVQTANLQQVGRARQLTIATQLARAKSVDIEHALSHDGFVAGTAVSGGDFAQEGHPEVTYQAKTFEVRLELDQLASAFGQRLGKAGGDREVHGDDLSSALQLLGPMLSSLLAELGASIRLVQLQLTWPSGSQQRQLELRWLVGLDDFATMQASEVQRLRDEQQGATAGARGAL